MALADFTQLSLTPLGPGDLIDRAIRLYRQHFATLLRIAAPPTLVAAFGSVALNVGWRGATKTDSDASLALYVMVALAGFVLWFVGMLLNLIVMGGASRNLVTHLLWGEAVSARATYRNVKARFGGLLGASFVVFIGLATAFGVALVIFYICLIIALIAIYAAVQLHPYLAFIAAFVSVTVFFLAASWIFFFLAGKLAYVPQVMLIEGKGVGEALSRSISLAKKNVKRLMALVLFSTFATYSALMVFVIPLLGYGYLNGVNISPFEAENWPAWYSICYTVLSQASTILLAPVWVLGLSLMYLDERVRQEGYDLELLAAQQLGAMPELSPSVSQFYNPAVVATPASQASGSTLGLT